jgi:hypothetical protein
MAAHMRLLEAYAPFRERRGSELATARNRSLAAAVAVPRLVTVDVVVNVVEQCHRRPREPASHAVSLPLRGTGG